MKTFQTNLKCSGCVAAVKPALDEIFGTENWNVDLTSVDKLLTVKENSPEAISNVIAIFNQKGYEAKPQ